MGFQALEYYLNSRNKIAKSLKYAISLSNPKKVFTFSTNFLFRISFKKLPLSKKASEFRYIHKPFSAIGDRGLRIPVSMILATRFYFNDTDVRFNQIFL